MELKRHLDFISITLAVIKWTFCQDTIYKINKILERRWKSDSDNIDKVVLVTIW